MHTALCNFRLLNLFYNYLSRERENVIQLYALKSVLKVESCMATNLEQQTELKNTKRGSQPTYLAYSK